MARDYADRAKTFLAEAENSFSAGDNATCVRRSQEALEPAVKAVLRQLSIEYPREHDVSEAMETAAGRLPEYLKRRLEDLNRLLSELANVPGPALYGYEVEGIPASEAFTNEYASETLAKVKELVSLCVKFVSG